MTGKLTSIELALKGRLKWFADTAGYQVAWEDVAFQPVEGVAYLEPRFLPNKTDLAAVGVNAQRRHRGLFGVMVHGLLGQGSAVNGEIADAVIEAFPTGLELPMNGLVVRIGTFDGSTGVPYRSSAIRQDAWSNIPVTIPWYCDTQN